MKDEDFEIHPSSYAREIDLNFKYDISINEVRDRVINVLSEITAKLRERGCKLIGHIKALLDAGHDGKLFFSVTDFDKNVQCKGNIVRNVANAKFIINVIVFGVDVSNIEKTVNVALEELEL